MRKLAFVTAVGVIALPAASLAASSVSPATVLELRQMAIAAGQSSSSSAEKPAVDPSAAEAERKSIDRHREDFFARVGSGDSTPAIAQETREPSPKPLVNKDQATRLGQVILSVLQTTTPTVDNETIAALRQQAIDAGQVSRSSDGPAAGNPQAVEAERTAIDGHKADFFARVYGDTLVM